MNKIMGMFSTLLLCTGITATHAAEKDLRHVVYETITGEIALDTNIARGESIAIIHIIDWQELGVPVSTVNTEYKFRFHRIGDSGDEYVEPDAEIVVGDSVHYRAEMTDTLYKVIFYEDSYFGKEELKDTWSSVRNPAEPPKTPYHKGLIFDGWDPDFTKLKEPTTVNATYKLPPDIKFNFKVSGYDFGKTIDDLKIESPNKYFKITNTLTNIYGEEITFDKESIYDRFRVNINLSVEAADDSLVNIWNFMNHHSIDYGRPQVFVNNKERDFLPTSTDYSTGKIAYTIFRIEFFDYNGTLLKQELVADGGSATPPKDPSRKGLVFKGWNVKFDSVTAPGSSWAEYEVKKIPEYAYTVTGFDSGKSTNDIEIKAPNNCFASSVKNLTLDGKDFKGTITKSGTYELIINVAISDTGSCDNDSLANIARILNSNQGLKNAFTVNGDSALYKGIGQKQGELTYSKKITVAEATSSSSQAKSSSSVKATSSSSQAKSSSSVKATSSSSQAKSSSSVKATSSSSKAKSSSSGKTTSSSSKAKSSSSSKSKDALPALTQRPQFALTTIGRDIQIVGARIGSNYDVFDMQGHVITKGRTNATNFNLTMNHAGMYLVKIGDQAQKVQVK